MKRKAKPKYRSHWDPNDPAEVARSKLRQEVKAGRMVRADACELCGADGRTFGHHHRGYDYPLDVWWVCISCNRKLDKHDGSQTKEEARRQVAFKKKTDNRSLGIKLAIRRHFLDTYHPEPLRVLDCCQGAGVVWQHLKEEYKVASYWGVDQKPKKGRLRFDSSRLLRQTGWTEDVVDVDTYGMPWKHWFAVLEHFQNPVTVFMTESGGGKTWDRIARHLMRWYSVNEHLPAECHGRCETRCTVRSAISVRYSRVPTVTAGT